MIQLYGAYSCIGHNCTSTDPAVVVLSKYMNYDRRIPSCSYAVSNVSRYTHEFEYSCIAPASIVYYTPRAAGPRRTCQGSRNSQSQTLQRNTVPACWHDSPERVSDSHECTPIVAFDSYMFVLLRCGRRVVQTLPRYSRHELLAHSWTLCVIAVMWLILVGL